MFYVDGITKTGKYKVLDTDDEVVDILTYDELCNAVRSGIVVGGTEIKDGNLIVRCKSESVWNDLADSVNRLIALLRFKYDGDFSKYDEVGVLEDEANFFGLVDDKSNFEVYRYRLLLVLPDRGLIYSCTERRFLNEVNIFNKKDAPLLVEYSSLKSFDSRYLTVSGKKVYLMDIYCTLVNMYDVFSFENILYIGGVSSSRTLYFVIRMPNDLCNCYRLKVNKFDSKAIDDYYKEYFMSDKPNCYLAQHIKYLLSIKTLNCYDYMISDIKLVKKSTSKTVAIQKIKSSCKSMYDIFYT